MTQLNWFFSGEVTCESLDQNACAFAVSASGKRCVLEKQVKRSGQETYTCKTSEIEAEKLNNWIETDQCIKSCGLDRKSLGISSDSLLESGFTQKLCSSPCYGSCPNIVDLYFNLAAGEGTNNVHFFKHHFTSHVGAELCNWGLESVTINPKKKLFLCKILFLSLRQVLSSLYISVVTVSNQNLSTLRACTKNMNLIFLFFFWWNYFFRCVSS